MQPAQSMLWKFCTWLYCVATGNEQYVEQPQVKQDDQCLRINEKYGLLLRLKVISWQTIIEVNPAN